ncbi:MAG: hypothetical protein BWY25_00515 [Chloroflexi bacterium ADurb.Bin222]|nr:MAG: hypothetical protein BWY25_00515 [Chloroflexi bacterium ADurb.Bin222]
MALLKVYQPLPRFPALSLSGTACELQCRHCTAMYLAGMRSVATPEALLAAGRRLRDGGALGALLSGGSTREGALLNLKPLAGAIQPATETAQRIFGLRATTADYRAAYERLRAAGIPVIPHLTVYEGSEAALLEGIAPPETVVIIVFAPTPGTPMATTPAPAPEAVSKVFRGVRERFPQAELALGCMRPRDRRMRAALELAALEAGATRIELPARATLDAARARGHVIQRFEACCALPRALEAHALAALASEAARRGGTGLLTR